MANELLEMQLGEAFGNGVMVLKAVERVQICLEGGRDLERWPAYSLHRSIVFGAVKPIQLLSRAGMGCPGSERKCR